MHIQLVSLKWRLFLSLRCYCQPLANGKITTKSDNGDQRRNLEAYKQKTVQMYVNNISNPHSVQHQSTRLSTYNMVYRMYVLDYI